MTVRKPNESTIDYALRSAREFASELSQYDGCVLPKAAFSRARDVIGDQEKKFLASFANKSVKL